MDDGEKLELMRGVLADLQGTLPALTSTALITATLTNNDLVRAGLSSEVSTIDLMTEVLEDARLTGAVLYEMLGLILTLLRELERTHGIAPLEFLQAVMLRRETS